jgi:hypothetical protein
MFRNSGTESVPANHLLVALFHTRGLLLLCPLIITAPCPSLFRRLDCTVPTLVAWLLTLGAPLARYVVLGSACEGEHNVVFLFQIHAPKFEFLVAELPRRPAFGDHYGTSKKQSTRLNQAARNSPDYWPGDPPPESTSARLPNLASVPISRIKASNSMSTQNACCDTNTLRKCKHCHQPHPS